MDAGARRKGVDKMKTEELEAIRKRAEAKTFGWWDWAKTLGENKWIILSDPMSDVELATVSNRADAEFIANASIDIPKLLAEVERLRADQERLITELKKADQLSEELERKYMTAKWPEVMADINEFVAKKRRELHGGNL
jgi:hypothetical protein